MKKIIKVLPIVLIVMLLAMLLTVNISASDVQPMDSEYRFRFTDFLSSSEDLRTDIINNPGLLNCLIGSRGVDLDDELVSGVVEDLYIQKTSADLWVIYWIVDGSQWIYNLSTAAGYNIEFYVDEATYQYVLQAFGSFSVDSFIQPLSIGVLGVFSRIPGFLVSMFSVLVSLFFNNGSFTFIGVLALASLAFALILLLFTVIRKFIAFRG